ncbi:MAG: hypothetical protein PVI40_08650 [Chlamydiota bacterium]|jgi:hypothetical protein
MRLLLIFTIIASLIFSNEIKAEDKQADIQSSYSYFGLGIGPLPVPAFTINVGNRFALGNNFAIDTGVTLATLIRYNALRGYIDGLCYINQQPSSQYYVGIGGSIGGVFGFNSFCDEGFVAPNFLVGKEFFNSTGEKRFFQVEALYPQYLFNEKKLMDYLPLLTLKYGMSF